MLLLPDTLVRVFSIQQITVRLYVSNNATLRHMEQLSIEILTKRQWRSEENIVHIRRSTNILLHYLPGFYVK